MRTEVKYLGAVTFLILTDRIVTTLFWELEANPILIGVGVIGMWVLPIIFLPMFGLLFYNLIETDYEWVAKGLCIALSMLYITVIISNVALIIS